MKKLTFLLCASLLLAACGTAEETSLPDPQEPAEQETEEPVQPGKVIWVKEPSMKLDIVGEMKAYPYILGARIEYTGYPSEWAAHAEADYNDKITGYRNDCLIAGIDGRYGIIDYNGNAVWPFNITKQYDGDDSLPVVYQPYTGFVVYDTDESASVFDAGFTSRSEVLTGGLGGWAPTPYVRNHEVLIDDPASGAAMAYENQFDARQVMDVTDDNGNAIGCAVIAKDTSIMMETDYHCSSFVNGIVTVTEKDDWNDPGKTGFVSAEGKDITGGPVYEKTGFFMEGYAPVKINGKWAYIDEEGRQVTEAVFTYASMINGGRAFVEYNGLYGVLDLANTLKQNIPVNDETCSGDYHEEPFEEQEAAQEESIGILKVLIDNLNSRSLPSTDGEKLGKPDKGSEWDVYEIREAEGYTWYRIGKDRWVADGGGWVEYTEN
ncbi:MAG: WG repeat-containing protein [Solobacterium sp.]|nr:WG repeat-containing protein [Solobacterium sp.]